MTALAGRLGLVAGASRGIGAAVAAALAQSGARVVRVARRLQECSAGTVHDIPCDLVDADGVERLAQRVESKHGVPELVVSSVGAFLLQPLERTTAEEFAEQIAVNLRAPFALARAFLPRMRQVGRGIFVTIGSVADHTGFPENAAYAASKYGLRGLHETLAAEFRGSGVRLTLISPGPTDTSVWDRFDPDHREGFPQRAAMLRPADVAEAVLFVATRPDHVHIDWLRLAPRA